MNKNYYGVIMAGGIGSRFWPMSRKKLPKQFIDIFGTGETLFQSTYKRLLQLCLPENIYIVTNESYRELIKVQAPDIKDEQILGEPHARNTAPCVAYAGFKIAKENPEAVMAVLPSDHLILDDDAFVKTMQKAYDFASENDNLITLGIKPTRPDTGYGYIQFDEDKNKEGIFKVKTFTEKPNQELAEYFVNSGEFLWNSGMFIWKASVIKQSIRSFMPEIYDLFSKAEKHLYTVAENKYITRVYEVCPSISIDYGVMEKADNVYVLPATFHWSDIGTWSALHDFSKKDDAKNLAKGDNIFIRNSENCIVKVSSMQMVAVNSVKNLIIVESDGILLVADIDKEQEIRHVVNDIKILHGEKFT